jgi:predicted ferric reductase
MISVSFAASLLVLIHCLTHVVSADTSVTVLASQSYSSPKGFASTWNITSDNVITFNMSAHGYGWISLGFSDKTVNAHAGSDMVVAWIDSAGSVQIIDGFSAFEGQPTYDALQNANVSSGAVVNGKIWIEWFRILDTGDSAEDYAISNSPLMLAWGFHSTINVTGTGAAATYPFHTNYGHVIMNLYDGEILTWVFKWDPALALTAIAGGSIIFFSIIRLIVRICIFLCRKGSNAGICDTTDSVDPLRQMRSSRDDTFLRGSMPVNYKIQKKVEHFEDEHPAPILEDVPETYFSPTTPGTPVGEREDEQSSSGAALLDEESKGGHQYGSINASQVSAKLTEISREARRKKSSSATMWTHVTRGRLPFSGSQTAIFDIVIFGIYAFINLGFIIIWPLKGFTPAITLGYLSIANAFLLALPATRNSVLVYLLGAPFDKTIQFHRWLGYLCLIEATFHWAYYFPYTLEWTKCISGFTAWCFVAFIFLTSLESLRRDYFNVFYLLHFVFIGFYITGSMHTWRFTRFAIAAAVFYGLDRLIRFFTGAFPEKTLDIAMHEGAVKIQFKKKNFRFYDVGQYVFLNFPGLSLLEWHPFTLTSSPHDKNCEVMIKGLGDHTKKLIEQAKNHGSLWIRVDGPYGAWPFDILQYKTIILVGAGVGVTPCISALKYIYDVDGQNDYGTLKNVFFVWSCRDLNAYSWFSDTLEMADELGREKGFPTLYVHFPC